MAGSSLVCFTISTRSIPMPLPSVVLISPSGVSHFRQGAYGCYHSAGTSWEDAGLARLYAFQRLHCATPRIPADPASSAIDGFRYWLAAEQWKD